MTWENSAITITTLLPIVGALVIVAMPRDKERPIRALGIVFTGAALVLAIAIAVGFDYGTDGLQYVLDVNWISAIGVRYHVGIDGISLPLYVLTFLLSFLCAIYTWRYVPDPGRTKAFLALMLLLETGMAGTFIAFDLILFFVFWELVLVPMYFLIGIWGSANREYASIKFFLYTLFGSIFMLLGFLAMYFQGPDPHTFDMVELRDYGLAGGFSQTFQLVVFGAVALGFAVKVPMWPFHTWLPDAHTEAPTIGSVLLAGIMLKMGTYGFIRIAIPFMPVRRPEVRAVDRRARRDRDRLRGARVPGAEGPETPDRVLVGGAHGVRDARHRDAHRDRHPGGDLRHGRPRRDHRHAVLLRRVDLRPLPHAGDRGDRRRHVADDAEARRRVRVRRDRLARAPRARRVLGRGHGAAQLVQPERARSADVGLFRVFMVVGGIGTVLTAGYFLWMLQRVNMGTLPDQWRKRASRRARRWSGSHGCRCCS